MSNHRPERILAHPARFLSFISHRSHRFTQIILRCKQRSYTIGIRNKEGAASEKEFTIAKNIEGFRLRARGTGEFSAKTINLGATLKKASALLGDGTTPDTTPDTDKGTTGGENTDQGGSGTTGEGGGDGLE